jgi:hypothetical protein
MLAIYGHNPVRHMAIARAVNSPDELHRCRSTLISLIPIKWKVLESNGWQTLSALSAHHDYDIKYEYGAHERRRHDSSHHSKVFPPWGFFSLALGTGIAHECLSPTGRLLAAEQSLPLAAVRGVARQRLCTLPRRPQVRMTGRDKRPGQIGICPSTNCIV